MAQGGRLQRFLGLPEQRLLAKQAILERQHAGGFHRGKDQARNLAAFPARFVLGAVVEEEFVVQLVGRVRIALFRAGRSAGAEQLVGIGAGVVQQAFRAFRDSIENADQTGAVGVQLVAGKHDVERRLGADQARQALGAASAGQQTEVDFRQADAGIRRADAITAGQCQLQATAESQFADGGDQRLVDLRQARQQARESGRCAGGRAARLTDIGAGAEQAIEAIQDDRPHCRVGGGPLAGFGEGGTQRLFESIDRRVGQTDQGQPVFEVVMDCAHGVSWRCRTGQDAGVRRAAGRMPAVNQECACTESPRLGWGYRGGFRGR
ncbi:hypothetical protein D9M71_387530 [compost metagenome]